MTIYKENILFVDEDELFCEGLLKYFNSQSSFEIIGVASEWSEALEKAEALLPEIIVLNIHKVHSDWIATVRFIRQRLPFTTVVVLSNNRKRLDELMKAGGNAFLSKDLAFKDILHFIGSVNENSALIYPQEIDFPRSQPEQAPSDSFALSKREKEIIGLVSKGLQNKEIADVLSIKIPTVNNHLYNIYRKLGCSNRTEAVFAFFKKNETV